MKRHGLWGILALLAALGAAGSLAQSLTEAQLRTVPVAARRLYQQAMDDFDHMNAEGGVHTLAQAAEMCPGIVPMQQMLAERALAQAQGADNAETAQEWVEIGRAACQRIGDNASASEAERAEAQEISASLDAAVSEAGVRDTRREEGYQQYIVGQNQGLHAFQGVREGGGSDGSSSGGGGGGGSGSGRVIRIRDAGRFMDETSGPDPVLVDFCAEWCHVCDSLEPIIRDYARSHHVKVLSVDIDDNPGLADSHGVSAVPTLVLYQNGGIVRQQTGAPLSVDGLAQFVGR